MKIDLIREFEYIADFHFWDYESMSEPMRFNGEKSINLMVFIDFVRWDLSLDYFCKKRSHICIINTTTRKPKKLWYLTVFFYRELVEDRYDEKTQECRSSETGHESDSERLPCAGNESEGDIPHNGRK